MKSKDQLKCSIQQEAHQLVGRQNTEPQTFYPKPAEAAFGHFFSKFDQGRPKVADNVISGVAVDYYVDVRVKLGDSRLNSG